MDALFAIECGHALLAARDRLSRAHFDAQLRLTVSAEFRTNEDDVIGVARRRLYATSHQQCILM